LTKLADLKAEELYAQNTARTLELARIQHEQDEVRSDIWEWRRMIAKFELSTAINGLSQLKDSPLRPEFIKLLKSFQFDYFAEERRKGVPRHSVDMEIDDEIPLVDNLKNH